MVICCIALVILSTLHNAQDSHQETTSDEGSFVVFCDLDHFYENPRTSASPTLASDPRQIFTISGTLPVRCWTTWRDVIFFRIRSQKEMGWWIWIRHWQGSSGTSGWSVNCANTCSFLIPFFLAPALDKVSPFNWLDDNFWMNKAYLEWRAPLLVNSNWWLAFADDSVMPRSALSGETNDNRAGTTFWQLRRASWLLHRMLKFRDNALSTWAQLLLSKPKPEGLPLSERQEASIGLIIHLFLTSSPTHYVPYLAGSWLLENIESMFNIARIPEPFCDTISEPPPHTSREARSILVMIHNWCYSMVVYRPSSFENPSSQHTLLQPGEIEAHLRAIVLDVESRLANGEKALPVGVLSADERDRWAEVCIHINDVSKLTAISNTRIYDICWHSHQ